MEGGQSREREAIMAQASGRLCQVQACALSRLGAYGLELLCWESWLIWLMELVFRISCKLCLLSGKQAHNGCTRTCCRRAGGCVGAGVCVGMLLGARSALSWLRPWRG
eukprot:1202433-Rhodomonas_salina.1